MNTSTKNILFHSVVAHGSDGYHGGVEVSERAVVGKQDWSCTDDVYDQERFGYDSGRPLFEAPAPDDTDSCPY
jgi:hypothetical protein